MFIMWLPMYMKKNRPPLCTMHVDACRCTMQVDGAQHSTVLLQWSQKSRETDRNLHVVKVGSERRFREHSKSSKILGKGNSSQSGTGGQQPMSYFLSAQASLIHMHFESNNYVPLWFAVILSFQHLLGFLLEGGGGVL